MGRSGCGGVLMRRSAIDGIGMGHGMARDQDAPSQAGCVTVSILREHLRRQLKVPPLTGIRQNLGCGKRRSEPAADHGDEGSAPAGDALAQADVAFGNPVDATQVIRIELVEDILEGEREFEVPVDG